MTWPLFYNTLSVTPSRKLLMGLIINTGKMKLNATRCCIFSGYTCCCYGYPATYEVRYPSLEPGRSGWFNKKKGFMSDYLPVFLCITLDSRKPPVPHPFLKHIYKLPRIQEVHFIQVPHIKTQANYYQNH